jgi:hypothetical protein
MSIPAQRYVSVWGNRIGVYHQGEGMVRRTLRMALLVGAVTAAVVSPVRADHKAPCCNEPCGASAPCAPAPCAPQYRTITVTECVPETYTVKRTCYKYECRTELVDSCRYECVPEVRERTYCVTKRVPVYTTQTRKVCKNVTCYEDRTVMKTCYQTVQETCMRKELVCRGHWECREVPCHSHSLFRGHGHRNNDCCDPCATTCCAPPTRTVRVWVNCPQYCERPYTVCKKVCVQVPYTCKVAVCKQVWENVTCQVCTYQCVTEQRCEKYTCMVQRAVPCKVSRTVRVCVPYEECVTCTRMVQRQKCVQVPVTTCCSPAPCCPSTCCETSCCGHGHRGLFRGRGHRHHNNNCCEPSCCN